MYFSIVSIVCISFLFCLLTFQLSQADRKPIGGNLVPSINSTAYQVSLQRYGSHFCSGTFISFEWVLTSARCTDRQDISTLQIRVASLNRTAGGVVIKLNEIIQHPNYDLETFDYDFSLLKLQNWPEESTIFGILRLPQRNEDVEDGTILTVSGWGSILFVNSTDDLLHAEEVIKVNQGLCSGNYLEVGTVTDQMICADHQQENKDACQRDIGSPLVWNGTIVGVSSWGYGCTLSGYPDVYSRVSTARDWIVNHTRFRTLK